MLALLVDDSVRIVDPRPERHAHHLRRLVAPCIGGVKLVVDSEDEILARTRRLRGLLQPDVRLLERHRVGFRWIVRRSRLRLPGRTPRNAHMDVLDLLVEVARWREEHDRIDRRHAILRRRLEFERRRLPRFCRTMLVPREKTAVAILLHVVEMGRDVDASGDRILERHLHFEGSVRLFRVLDLRPAGLLDRAKRTQNRSQSRDKTDGVFVHGWVV